MEDNPFPAVMGRVCYHPCETVCNRAQLDEAVGINAVERFLGDEAIAKGWRVEVTAPPSGKRVLVVGAALRPLRGVPPRPPRARGDDRRRRPEGRGMMRFGIPRYRLPRKSSTWEIERIAELGVEIELNHKVTNILDAMREGVRDAAFLAVGAHLGKRGTSLPARPRRCWTRSRSAQQRARSGPCGAPRRGLRRRKHRDGCGTDREALGAEEVIVVYRRTRERMPAHDSRSRRPRTRASW